MRSRTLPLALAAVAAAVSLLPNAASAAPTTEHLSRSTYDSAPEKTTSTWRIDGATRGELGGYLDMTITATSGSLPTTRGECQPVSVDAVLTVEPGEVLTVAGAAGEACMHAFGDTTSVNAYFGKRQLSYEGTKHTRVRLVGDGMLSAGQLFTGSQASFNASLRW